ncbi:Lsr2 family protein [Acrocarpospora corrugata]|uniref:Lsr2 family protein n=1 Tax=Acrocarpospora corrugata TaxID=35763 RepID=A0A5M3VXG4_9ACTN|nr:Lsr2 family protein [Acrocarpospora corrugata]GES00392.1 Lsr2 family protein [Acrocarpospora corrugata]
MAKQVIEQVTDDLDGTQGAATYRFGWGKDTFEIDLAQGNKDKLEKFLAPYIANGRLVREARPARGRRSGGGESKLSREKSQEIREWAKANNHPVNERGRIAATILEAYEAAH